MSGYHALAKRLKNERLLRQDTEEIPAIMKGFWRFQPRVLVQ